MIEHRNTLISEELFEKHFVCDLGACHGSCCEVGDSGAPLMTDEAKLIKKHYKAIEPYMTERGKQSVKEQGQTSVVDMDGELVTPIVQEYAECVYAKKNEKGIWMCGIEQAHKDGKIPFNKPISCHLYPIRVTKLKYHDALNYHEWDICAPARVLGGKLGVPAFRFVKNALIREYGQDWYDELEVIYEEWCKQQKLSGKAAGKV
ncbi:MAG TPA: DUF3109 family protein [Flavobacteriales bacterium]|nr:DUF3109 family protein [Flavobacteriales bacterium]